MAKANGKRVEAQLDFFGVIDAPAKKREEENYYQERAAKYQKWCSLPDVTHIEEGDKKRTQTAQMVWDGGYDLYKDAEHACDTKPDNIKIWQNPCNFECWVLNHAGNAEGEKCDVCPHCKAELSKGKGDVVLYKADPWRWNMFLYYWTPLRERGFVTPEERKKADSRITIIESFSKERPETEREEMER
jgi:hypothetical protein